MRNIILFCLIGVTSAAAAQSAGRPDEGAMFGTPAASPAAKAPEAKASRDQTGLDASKPAHDAFASGEVADNAMQIGGLLYQRFNVSALNGTGASRDPVSSPTQVDLYMDARPSDRVRGFVDLRVLYDSSRDAYGNPSSGGNAGSAQYSSGSSAPSGFGGLNTSTVVNPQTVVDQAWLKFDVDQRVFITAGKQHLKWGSSRFWNPTDVLSLQKRDPLIPYDLRLGTNMVKVAIPFEGKGNLYAVTLLENSTPASTLGQLGEALRAERVVGGAEVGVDAVYRFNSAPIYGADLSTALGPLDLYLEGAYVASSSVPYIDVSQSGPLTQGVELSTQFTSRRAQPSAAQVSGGVNYSFAWRDNRQATVGVEYFYNQLGYDNSRAYPVLIFLNQYQPFYTGRNYGAFYLTAEGPDADKHTSYTLSTLSNLSDSSYITRLDFSWRFLTYLTFDAFVAGHYGRAGGEFNFALNTPALSYQGATVPAINLPPTVVDTGVALRMSF